MFAVDHRAIAQHLIADADAEPACQVLAAHGLTVTDCREVLIRRLRQDVPDELGSVARALAGAGVRIEAQYSDHDRRLILLTSNQATTAEATQAWSD